MRNLGLRMAGQKFQEKVEAVSVTKCKLLKQKTLIRVVGWTSLATGALAVGVLVGRNLRARYRMNHRTPYDLYSHAGDNGNVEFGVGT